MKGAAASGLGGAVDPRSAAAGAWRRRYVRTRIELCDKLTDNQIQIGMGDKSKWATTRFKSKLKETRTKKKRGDLHEGGAKHLFIFLIWTAVCNGRFAIHLDVPKCRSKFGPPLVRLVPSQLVFNWNPVCRDPTVDIIVIY